MQSSIIKRRRLTAAGELQNQNPQTPAHLSTTTDRLLATRKYSTAEAVRTPSSSNTGGVADGRREEAVAASG
jgi:hypothetical protein